MVPARLAIVLAGDLLDPGKRVIARVVEEDLIRYFGVVEAGLAALKAEVHARRSACAGQSPHRSAEDSRRCSACAT